MPPKLEAFGSANSTIASSIPLSNSVENPVTWHVLVWILIKIAINSMSQPAGKICGAETRYRFYLASSPLICMADALASICCIVSTMVYMKLTIIKSCKFCKLMRIETKAVTNENGEVEYLFVRENDHTWPRWILFIMGPLPSTIKLTSFTNIPMSKTIGFMYLAAFIILEGMSFASRFSTTRNLRLTTVQLEQYRSARTQLNNPAIRIRHLEHVLFFLALIIHIGIVVYAVHELLEAPIQAIYTKRLERVIGCFELTTIMMVLVLYGLWAILRYTGILQEGRLRSSTPAWLGKILMVTYLLPRRPRSPGETITETMWLQEANTYNLPFWLLVYGFYVCNEFLTVLCRVRPIIGKALLIQPDVVVGVSSLSESERGAAESLERKSLDTRACFNLYFFLVNLVVLVSWCAFRYDPTGTVNPPWTDIFGR